MQSASSRIWTRVAVSISYDDNHYTTVVAICFIEVIEITWFILKRKLPSEVIKLKQIITIFFNKKVIKLSRKDPLL